MQTVIAVEIEYFDYYRLRNDRYTSGRVVCVVAVKYVVTSRLSHVTVIARGPVRT